MAVPTKDLKHLLGSLSRPREDDQDEVAKKVLLLLQVKDSEIRSLEADRAELRNEVRECRAAAERLAGERDGIAGKLKKLAGAHGGVDRLRAELRLADAERGEVVREKQIALDELQRASARAEKLEAALQEQTVRSDALEREAVALRAAAGHERSLARNLSEQLALQREEAGDAGAALATWRQSAAAATDTLEKQAETLRKELESERHARKADREQAAALSRGCDDAGARAERAEAAAAELEKTVSFLKEARRQLEGDFADVEIEREKAVEKLASEQLRTRECEKRARDAAAEADAARRGMEEAAAARDEKAREVERVKGRHEALRREAAAERSRVDNFEMVVVHLKGELEASNTARSDLEQTLADERAKAGGTQREIAVLREDLEARQAALALLELEQADLVSAAAAARAAEEAVETQARELALRVELLQSELTLREDALDDVQAKTDERISDLAGQLCEAENLLADAEKTVEDARGQRATLEADLSSTRAALKLSEAEASRRASDAAVAQAELEAVRESQVRCKKALRRAKGEREAAFEQLAAVRAEFDDVSSRSVRDQHGGQQVISSLAAAQKDLKEQLLASKQEAEDLRSEVDRLEDAIAARQRDARTAEAKADEAASGKYGEREAAFEQLAAVRAEFDDVVSSRSVCDQHGGQQVISSLAAAQKDLREGRGKEQLLASKQEATELSQEREQLSAKVAELKIQLSEAKADSTKRTAEKVEALKSAAAAQRQATIAKSKVTALERELDALRTGEKSHKKLAAIDRLEHALATELRQERNLLLEGR
eukprot:gene7212-11098_t